MDEKKNLHIKKRTIQKAMNHFKLMSFCDFQMGIDLVKRLRNMNPQSEENTISFRNVSNGIPSVTSLMYESYWRQFTQLLPIQANKCRACTPNEWDTFFK